MRKIKTIAMKTMQLGFAEDSEKILRSLLLGQLEQMGTLHEETLDTFVLLGYNLALLKRSDDITDLLAHLSATRSELSYDHTLLNEAIQELEEVLNPLLQTVG